MKKPAFSYATNKGADQLHSAIDTTVLLPLIFIYRASGFLMERLNDIYCKLIVKYLEQCQAFLDNNL